MDQLKEHPQIVELLDTLDKNGLMKEKNEVQSLVSYIGGMEETLTEMLGELQDISTLLIMTFGNAFLLLVADAVPHIANYAVFEYPVALIFRGRSFITIIMDRHMTTQKSLEWFSQKS